MNAAKTWLASKEGSHFNATTVFCGNEGNVTATYIGAAISSPAYIQ